MQVIFLCIFVPTIYNIYIYSYTYIYTIYTYACIQMYILLLIVAMVSGSNEKGWKEPCRSGAGQRELQMLASLVFVVWSEERCHCSQLSPFLKLFSFQSQVGSETCNDAMMYIDASDLSWWLTDTRSLPVLLWCFVCPRSLLRSVCHLAAGMNSVK